MKYLALLLTTSIFISSKGCFFITGSNGSISIIETSHQSICAGNEFELSWNLDNESVISISSNPPIAEIDNIPVNTMRVGSKVISVLQNTTITFTSTDGEIDRTISINTYQGGEPYPITFTWGGCDDSSTSFNKYHGIDLRTIFGPKVQISAVQNLSSISLTLLVGPGSNPLTDHSYYLPANSTTEAIQGDFLSDQLSINPNLPVNHGCRVSDLAGGNFITPSDVRLVFYLFCDNN